MTKVPIPKPSYLDDMESYTYSKQKRWRSSHPDRIYTWDSLHGEIEVFNKRGKHLGVLDPVTGEMIKEPVKGRKIDV